LAASHMTSALALDRKMPIARASGAMSILGFLRRRDRLHADAQKKLALSPPWLRVKSVGREIKDVSRSRPPGWRSLMESICTGGRAVLAIRAR
jgi:hypothetical protein